MGSPLEHSLSISFLLLKTITPLNPGFKLMVEIPVPPELVSEMEEDFRQGPIFDDEGRRFLTEEQVARFNGLVVVIQADEHPPPHFHVRYNGENASFAITNGARLPGITGLESYDRNIRKWWKKNYCVLIRVWNATRPTDCQVGSMAVPDECRDDENT
jgi:hypothetical protein